MGERSERRVRIGQFHSGVGDRRNLTRQVSGDGPKHRLQVSVSHPEDRVEAPTHQLRLLHDGNVPKSAVKAHDGHLDDAKAVVESLVEGGQWHKV